MPSQLLIDVDAFVKLAHWGLLEELARQTGVSSTEWRTTSSLKYRAMAAVKAPDGKLFHTAKAAKAVLSALQQDGADVPDLPMDADALSQLAGVPAIDPGETLLLSALVADQDAWLLTGDKRSVVAVSSIPAVAAKIEGRVISVEQILLRALDTHSLAWLREHVCPARHFDKAVSAIMGSQCTADEASVRQALASYIQSQRATCHAPLLIDAL